MLAQIMSLEPMQNYISSDQWRQLRDLEEKCGVEVDSVETIDEFQVTVSYRVVRDGKPLSDEDISPTDESIQMFLDELGAILEVSDHAAD